MRCNETEGVSALFVNDGITCTIVECSNCKTENYDSVEPGESLFCENCRSELVYRPWYEW